MRKSSLLFSVLLLITFFVISGFVVPVHASDYTPFVDTWAYSYAPNTNYGSSEEIDASSQTYFRYGYLNFNISFYVNHVLAGGTVEASLRLFVHLTIITSDADLTVWATHVAWNESTLTYNNRPSVSEVIGSVHINHNDGATQYVYVDVSEYVNLALSSYDDLWEGIVVGGSNNNIVWFKSKEGSGGSGALLTVNFATGGNPSGWVQVPNFVQFIVLFVICGMPAMVLSMYGAKNGWGLQGLLFGAFLGLGIGICVGLIPFWFVFLLSLFLVVFLYSIAKRS